MNCPTVLGPEPNCRSCHARPLQGWGERTLVGGRPSAKLWRQTSRHTAQRQDADVSRLVEEDPGRQPHPTPVPSVGGAFLVVRLTRRAPRLLRLGAACIAWRVRKLSSRACREAAPAAWSKRQARGLLNPALPDAHLAAPCSNSHFRHRQAGHNRDRVGSHGCACALSRAFISAFWHCTFSRACVARGGCRLLTQLCGVGRRQPDVSTSPGPATRRGAAPPTSAP